MDARLREASALARALATIACAALAAGCTPGAKVQASRHDAGVRLSPDPAFTTSRIQVVFEEPGLDRARCSYAWLRNGAPIPGANADLLEPASFHSGDLVAVVVTVRNPGEGRTCALRAETRVEKMMPRITSVTLSQGGPPEAPVIQADVACAHDGAWAPSYRYRWFRNDQRIPGAEGASVPAAGLVRGDRIAAEVVASDGSLDSAPVRSAPITLANHAPQFTSTPSAPGATDAVFRYQAAATDADGDSLRFELGQGPAGMNVEPGGTVTWSMPPSATRSGDVTVSLRVSDPEGAVATQEFTLHLSPGRAAVVETKRPAPASTPQEPAPTWTRRHGATFGGSGS